MDRAQRVRLTRRERSSTCHRRAALGAVLLALISATARPALAGERGRDIVEALRAAGGFTTFVGALEATGLAAWLAEPGPFTLLAPTDEAFANLPADEFVALLENRARLIAVLGRHILLERVTLDDLTRRTTLEPIQGESVHIAFGAYGIKLDGAAVIWTDLPAWNGVIHVIDTVLLPR